MRNFIYKNNALLLKIFEARFQIFSNATLFLFYFLICVFTPYAADDFFYKINPNDYALTMTKIGELFDFQIWHYFNWGGRITVIFLIQLFLLPSKILFNIVNALIQVMLINTIFYYSFHKVAMDKRDAFFLFLINNLIFLSFYKYSGVSIYLTSTINYTWMHLLVLLYYIPYLKFYLYGKNKFKFPLLFGIVAGCTNEHVFIAQLFLFFGLYFLHFYKKIKIPTYFFRSFIGVFIGGLILLSAPGNFIRAKTISFDISFNSLIDYLTYDINWLILYLKPLWFLFIVLTVIYFLLGHRFKYNYPTVFLFFIGMVSSLAMSFSPSFHNGTNLFFFFALIIFILSLFDITRVGNWSFALITSSTLILFTYLLYHHLLINKYAMEIEEYIINQKSNGNLELVVDKYPSMTNRFINYYGIETDPKCARNKHIAEYYGLTTIQTLEN